MPKILFVCVLLSGLIVAGGCGKDTDTGDNNEPVVDAGVDAGPDAGDDTGPDAGDDTGPDADTGDVGHEDVEPDTGDPDPIPCDDDYDCAPNQICGDEGFCAPCVPNAGPEICDGRDTNCNGEVDEGCDKDGDGYCDAEMVVVEHPRTDQWPAVCPEGPGDCDDTRADVHPNAQESCNNVDMNCDGVLPQLILDSPSLIRGAVSFGGSAEMVRASTNPGSPYQYAVVWQERALERTVIRFARLTRTASATSGVSPLTTVTGPGRVGLQPSMAWDAITGNFGVAWYGPDESGGWSVYFAMLDANGAVVVPQVRVGADVGLVDSSTDSLRVVVAGGHFGVFYSVADGDDLELNYAPFDISARTLGAATSFTLDAARTVASASFTSVDDRILIAWAIDARRYYGGAIDAATGTAVETFGTQPLPGTYSTAALRLFTLYGSPYLLFQSGSNLILQPIDDGFNLDGTAHTLAADASSTLFALSENDDGGFTLFYGANVMQIARFTQDWTAVAGSEVTTALSSPATRRSQFQFFVHGPSNTLQYLSQANIDGFFRFFSLNVQTGATLLDGYPITAEPYTSVYATTPRLTYFDEATDSIVVVQSTGGFLESYSIAADGTATLPTRLGATHMQCVALEEFEGRLRCISQFETTDPCQNNISVYEYDGDDWPLIASAAVPGFIEGESCDLYWYAGALSTADGVDYVLYRDTNTERLTAHLRVTGIDTFSLKELQVQPRGQAAITARMAFQGENVVVALVSRKEGAGSNVSVEIYSIDNNGDFVLTPRVLIADKPMNQYTGPFLVTTRESAAVLLTFTSGSTSHFFRRINTQTGVMDPLEIFADANTLARSRFLVAAGESFMFDLHRWVPPMSDITHELVFMKPGGVKIIRPVDDAASDFWPVVGLAVDPDYFVTVESNNYGLRTRAFDADGDLITSDTIALENASYITPTVFHTGEELRFFVRGDPQTFAGRGTCH